MRFATEASYVEEGQGSASIRVERSGALSVGRATVDYATSPRGSTATAGADYVETSGTLVFETGENVRWFTVPIRDDNEGEDTEQLVLALSNPQGDASDLGPPAYLLILDDDARAASSEPGEAKPSRTRQQTRVTSVEPKAAAATPTSAVAPRPVAKPRSRARGAATSRPPTPFILRPPSPSQRPPTEKPLAVEPLLAVLAALFIARLSAEIWFRSRQVYPRR
jgi:hypothetical protein